LLRTSPDYKNAKIGLEAGFVCCVHNFNFGWLIYGNTFHYSDEAYACSALNEDTSSLWWLMMFIIAFGYLIFFMYALIACLVCGLLCAFIF
jgi:hypothetical protein